MCIRDRLQYRSEALRQLLCWTLRLRCSLWFLCVVGRGIRSCLVAKSVISMGEEWVACSRWGRTLEEVERYTRFALSVLVGVHSCLCFDVEEGPAQTSHQHIVLQTALSSTALPSSMSLFIPVSSNHSLHPLILPSSPSPILPTPFHPASSPQSSLEHETVLLTPSAN